MNELKKITNQTGCSNKKLNGIYQSAKARQHQGRQVQHPNCRFRIIKINCKQCGQNVDYKAFGNFPVPEKICCEECHKKNESQAAENKNGPIDPIAEQFEKISPVWLKFFATDLKKLSDLTSYQKAIEWQAGIKGLTMIGKPGTGKTRAFWALLHRLVVAEKRNVEIFDSKRDFSAEISSRFSGDNAAANSWVRKIIETDIVAIDDLGKGAMTERVQGELWRVIDARINAGKPLIITLNRGTLSESEMTEDRLSTIKRRLNEFTTEVRFRK